MENTTAYYNTTLNQYVYYNTNHKQWFIKKKFNDVEYDIMPNNDEIIEINKMIKDFNLPYQNAKTTQEIYLELFGKS